MKHFLSLLIAFSLVCFAALAAAEDLPQRFFDNAGCFVADGPSYFHLDDAAAASTMELNLLSIQKLREQDQCDFAILTIDDFIGYDTHAELAAAFYSAMDIGIGPEKTGVLVLLDVNQSVPYIHIVGECQDWMTIDTYQYLLDFCQKALDKCVYFGLPDRCMMKIEQAHTAFLENKQ